MKIYKTIIIILTIFLFSGCEDFLDVTPEDRIDLQSFFSTDEEMVIGVNGVYAAQRQMITRGDGGSPLLFTLLESRSDNVGMDHTDQAERVETDLFNEGAGNLPISGMWEALWNVVNLANNVIASGPDAEGDESLINRTVGEAKFIRAFTYFHLVNIWGGVPLRTEPTVDFSETILPRSGVGAIYDLIVKDLTEAAAILPDEYDGSVSNEQGRATKGAALTLLGKAELQRGNSPAAVAALRQVEGKYSLLSGFADIHTTGNNNTDEAIYEVNFNPANQTGWGGNNAFIPANVAQALGIVAGGSTRAVLSAYPTQDLVDSYDPADLRIPGTFGITTDASAAYVGPYISKYIDLTAETQGSDINLVLLRYADVLLMLAEALGEGSEAYGYINQVRSRAGLPDIGSSDPGTFLEKVMNERRWELAFEFHRWIDMQRMPANDIISKMETQLEAQQLNKFGLTVDITLTNDNLLYPIPQGEIDISGGVVEQNPGY